MVRGVFFYIRDGYIGIPWVGVLAKGRTVVVLLLYQLLGVAILLQSLGTLHSSSAAAVGVEGRFLAWWFRVLNMAILWVMV